MNILEYKNVSKRFTGFSIKDVSFSLEPGYIMGLVGRNGAGKTTLFHLLLNHFSTYEGQILVNGMDVRQDEVKVKDKIAFISGEQNFFMNLNPLDNEEIYSPMYSQWDHDLYRYYLNTLEISKTKPLSTMSKGTFIKFQLAFAISHHPILYLMDEPTAGLDPVYRRDFLKTLQDMVAKENASILISTHITSDLDKIADYITLIEDGQIVLSKDRETLEEEFQLNPAHAAHLRVADLIG